ncbi:anaphase-promoting complex, cyclosome, subunit 4-domain-containing protein [Crepidotus variabilis]|uniref:Anaphase-promoting complex, cyclosome, subunit 4-domain-containing protein n=1 Tax=Crepidotus variabilis TaxID=179855 RepID=A0A9P6JN40_9AGAR|nr:anaphase-promoting complex, cyclosome, subunit 4-domain-containing protein [Crepidotus variabilis]
MSTNAFASLATARLAAQSRAYANSCCPDKDLIILFSRLGGSDRMSLWSLNQGSKKWEVDVGDANTGSAHSMLKILPLLDHLPDENDGSQAATDVFAFQGSQNRSRKPTGLPEVIERWPTLAPDHITASISTASYSKSTLEKAELDAMDTLTTKTILIAMDTTGNIFPFLDGIFPLGVTFAGSKCDFSELTKHPATYSFVGQPHFQTEFNSYTQLAPVVVHMPLLSSRNARDLANLSSTARELTWYIMRVVKEMREVWFGSDTQTGARELGPKWVKALEAKQKEFSAEADYDPILDLTSLLTTGRCSEALTDFLGSGQDMSDRGLQKWESTLIEALVKLRDFGEKRCASAFQRLFLVMDELCGWSKLPHFSVFDLKAEDLHAARDLAGCGVVISSWLASEARKELTRYREFGYWLHFEVNNIVLPNELNTPRHDILEVSHYFRSGLLNNSLDGWFTGPTPNLTTSDLNIPETTDISLAQAVVNAHEVLRNPTQTAWQMTVTENDLGHLDRNLEALVQELTDRCQQIFGHAAGAASRCVVVSSKPEQASAFPFRERITFHEGGDYFQHLMVHFPTEDVTRLLLAKLRVPFESKDVPAEIGISVLECYIPEEGESLEDCGMDILDAHFFDDESAVIVYRLRKGETFIGMLDYNETEYHTLSYDLYVNGSAREDLMQLSLELWKTGQVASTKVPINRRRMLSHCQNGGYFSMPKSTSNSSPLTPNHKKSKNAQNSANDGDPNDPNDAMRKKKNADAQAAFRQRRQNYITTLEETVTNLESVVLQLQDSCRESRTENMELRQELTRLRYESRERERYWKTAAHSRKNSQALDVDQATPSQMPSPYTSTPSSHSSTLLQHSEPFNSNGTYRAADPTDIPPFVAGPDGFASYQGTVPFTGQESGHDTSGPPEHRGGKFNGYSYPLQGSPRDERWQVAAPLASGLTGAEPIASHSQSPYVESPALTASTVMAGYPTRFPPDERKVALDNVLDNAPYIFPNGERYQTVPDSASNSRSMSPNSTGSSTSLPLTSSFPFAFQDPSVGQDRPEFDYRRQSLQTCPEVTLHGGTADISFQPQSNYRLVRRPVDQPPALQHGGPISQYEEDNYTPRNRAARRNIAHPYARSPSPGPAPISCTVAVIKAQSFGALRRTRTKPKKDTDGAAKVAINVLEARGLGTSAGAQGSHQDEDDMATP